MSATIKPRRGANLPTATIDGELLVDTSNKRVYVASGTIGSNANLVAAAAHGATAGLIQFRGTNAGELLSSSLYGVTLNGSTPTAVYIGASGSSEIPLTFNLNNASQNISKISLRAPTTVTVPDTVKYAGSTIKTTNGNTLTYVFPSALPGAFGSREFWGLRISDVNTSTGVATLTWTNTCSVCPVSIIDGTVERGGGAGGGIGNNNTWGQLLFARQPTSDDDPDATIIIDVADLNALRYDATTNTVITPKVQASDTIESTGLILKTGNTGKVKFVAESIEGSEVTVTVPYSAGGYSLLSTANKMSDLMADDWSNISAKLVGKQGSGDVVQRTSPTITTPTVENTLTLVDAANDGVINITAAANLNCEIFDNTAVTKISMGSSAGSLWLGGASTNTILGGPIFLSADIFTIGGFFAPITDTNKDKGVQFRWHNGTSAKTGFFGYDDSSGKFMFVPDATITTDVVSGDIGEINAKVEWANLLSVPSFATSSNNLGYFASTTSAQLATVISDETGSGSLVFGTSPSFTTGINGSSATMALFNNASVKTINFGSEATTINVGEVSGIVNFSNNVSVNNHFSAKSKSFVIDHPTKQGKKLRYACLEGPENGVYVRGELNGQDTIELPEYWINLVNKDSITVNLTGIGKAGYHTVKNISNNIITVESTTGNINCYYVVYAERKDIDKLITEYDSNQLL